MCALFYFRARSIEECQCESSLVSMAKKPTTKLKTWPSAIFYFFIMAEYYVFQGIQLSLYGTLLHSQGATAHVL